MSTNPPTVFASLSRFDKGGVQVIDDDARDYAFSNVFDVASKSAPYEKVPVAKNLKYVLEVLRAEGNSPWFATAHDESALVMDGDLTVHFIKPSTSVVPVGKEGTIKLSKEPAGESMGWVRVRRGHMALLPAGAAYQFRNAGAAGVLLLQTIQGDLTVEKWTDICQTV